MIASPPPPPATHPISKWMDSILDSHGEAWLALAKRCCGDHQYAEDALFEALAAMNRQMANGGVANPSAWMSTALRNRVSERLRKEANQRKMRDALAQFTPAAIKADPQAQADEAFVLDKTHWEAVCAALPHLPPRQREVIRLRLFEGMTSKDVAGQLGCAESAVHMAKSKAVVNLQHLIIHRDMAQTIWPTCPLVQIMEAEWIGTVIVNSRGC